ncbi:hypothetical protein IV70_GL001638 [Carnobacterium maltaromaticum DSM 20342]|nr:hypothetical protein IV70_GL001638 [Carnobacterium maltaromaticum DSM 20342]
MKTGLYFLSMFFVGRDPLFLVFYFCYSEVGSLLPKGGAIYGKPYLIGYRSTFSGTSIIAS